MPKRLAQILLAALFVFIASVRPVSAQTEGPVYIVQPGDTLFAIAGRFNLSVNDLIDANPSVDPGSLAVGQELVIPGLEGLTGKLETEVVTFGDSLRSLLRRTQVSSDNLRRLNRLIDPVLQRLMYQIGEKTHTLTLHKSLPGTLYAQHVSHTSHRSHNDHISHRSGS